MHEHLKDDKLKEINIIKIDRLDSLDFLNRLFRVKLQENNAHVESYLKWLGNLPYSDKQQYVLENIDIIFLDNVKMVISLCHDILNESCQKDSLLEELRDRLPPTSSFHGLAEQLYLHIIYNSGKLVDYIKYRDIVDKGVVIYLKNENIDQETVNSILSLSIKSQDNYIYSDIATELVKKTVLVADIEIKTPYENINKIKYRNYLMQFLRLDNINLEKFEHFSYQYYKSALIYKSLWILFIGVCLPFIVLFCFVLLLDEFGGGLLWRYRVRNLKEERLVYEQNKLLAEKLRNGSGLLYLSLIKYEKLFSAEIRKEMEGYYQELKDFGQHFYSNFKFNEEIIIYFERKYIEERMPLLNSPKKLMKI